MQKNIELYFVHGWGFDDSAWTDWLSLLEKSIIANLFDRGYFKNKKQSFNFNFSGRTKIVIAHSFGVHYLTAKDFSQIHMLILISSFSHFHDHCKNYKLSEKTINLMREKITTEPRLVIDDFYNNCGLMNAQCNSPIINSELLYDDLVLLNKHHLDLDYLKPIPQILLLHGKNDTIVNVEHSKVLHEKLPHSKLFLHEDAGHSLPITHKDWCISKIKNQFNKKTFIDPVTIAQEN